MFFMVPIMERIERILSYRYFLAVAEVAFCLWPSCSSSQPRSVLFILKLKINSVQLLFAIRAAIIVHAGKIAMEDRVGASECK